MRNGVLLIVCGAILIRDCQLRAQPLRPRLLAGAGATEGPHGGEGPHSGLPGEAGVRKEEPGADAPRPRRPSLIENIGVYYVGFG